MKNILFSLFVGAVFVILVNANEKYGARPRLNLDYITPPAFAHPVPGGRHNYRGQQPAPAQLDSLLATGLITRVIRLNGSGRDAGSMTPAEESRLCDKYGVEFHYINLHVQGAVIEVHNLLLRGQTFVH